MNPSNFFAAAESFRRVLCCGPYSKIDRLMGILERENSPLPSFLLKDACLGSHGLVELPEFFREPESPYSYYSFWQLANLLKEKPFWFYAVESFGLSDLPMDEPFRFPPGLLKAPSLNTLILKGLELKAFPKEILSIKKLKILDLSHNGLTELPEKLGGLKNLVYLSLSDNCLKTLPSRMGKLKKLQVLNLSGNALDGLGFSLNELRGLKRLNLSGNALSELPDGLSSLNQLERLLISYNDLSAEEEARWEDCYAAQIPSYQLHFAF